LSHTSGSNLPKRPSSLRIIVVKIGCNQALTGIFREFDNELHETIVR
jgi:hypothetical protein